MVRLNSITTKQGDGGKTMLGNGELTTKFDPRVEAYGTVDEASAAIGLAIVALPESSNNEIKTLLANIQQYLFNLGSILCCPEDPARPPRHPITTHNITFLETAIAHYNADLPPLESFILSGGTQASAHLHMARTLVRRAERRTVLLSQNEIVPENVIIYLNRLSDLLFILARTANDKGRNDILWQPDLLE